MVNALLQDPVKDTTADENAVDADGNENMDVAGADAPGSVALAAGGDNDPRGPLLAHAHEIEAPMFAISTPYAVVQRQLLRYDRETHLMPSVITYASQVRRHAG